MVCFTLPHSGDAPLELCSHRLRPAAFYLRNTLTTKCCAATAELAVAATVTVSIVTLIVLARPGCMLHHTAECHSHIARSVKLYTFISNDESFRPWYINTLLLLLLAHCWSRLLASDDKSERALKLTASF